MNNYEKKVLAIYGNLLSEPLHFWRKNDYDVDLISFTYREFLDDIMSDDDYVNILETLMEETEKLQIYKYSKASERVKDFMFDKYYSLLESGFNLKYFGIDYNVWFNETFAPGTVLSALVYVRFKDVDPGYIKFKN